MLKVKGIDIKGKMVVVFGFGNVVWGVVIKVIELGVKVVIIFGFDGYIYDLDGVSGDKIDYMLELCVLGNDIVVLYVEKYFNLIFVVGCCLWEVKVDIVFLCVI